MKIAKIIQGKRERFMEIVKAGTVKFDPRPDWVLVREIDVIDRKKNVEWVHPTEVSFVWIKEFV